ncbi:ATP-binding cassette domain-containing protein [Actinomadura kijaniata]|uniref:ATP-binding cassette domain-containing protein n=1 Tax=Actinomadura kijaniata TaxID=46161 RepID=UPI000830EB0E|nr:ATP-binding cassette domain-containing protein [Actinomadura kijaniata]
MPISFRGCAFGYRRGAPIFEDFTFDLPPGRTVLLGPNGAGKSTLLGLAASLLRPDGGTVSYAGLDPARRRDRAEFRRRVGWMPQQVRPMPGLTVREQISYSGWLKGLSRREAWHRSLEAMTAVNLGALAGRRCSQLSGGQLRRVGLASALVHDAEVILLDEPTAGLDPRQRETFREIVTRVGERRHVIVSTHQTEDLTALYRSVVVLDGARVRFAGATRDFLATAGPVGEASVERAYARLVTGEV